MLPADILAAIQRPPSTPDRDELIMPRTRINLKQLANGQWQPDYTCESFDADPLTHEGWMRINARLQALGGIVDDLIAAKNAEAPVPT